MPINPLKINSGLVTDYSWIQDGYTYGVNDSGPWQRFSRRGLNPDIEAWRDVLDAAGWTYTVTREKVSNATNQGVSKIEATAGWAFPQLYGIEVPENIWELDPQDEMKSLLEADFPNGAVALTSKDSSLAVAKIVEDEAAIWAAPGNPLDPQNPTPFGIVSGTNTIWAFDDGAGDFGTEPHITTQSTSVGPALITVPAIETRAVVHLPSADYKAAYSLYRLATAGVEVGVVEASIVRHSMLTSNQFSIKPSYINVGRVISTASMYAVEGVPTELLFDLPAMAAATQYVETLGDLQYGWKKARPAVARLSRMKWRITQNYIFGLWPVALYGTPL